MTIYIQICIQICVTQQFVTSLNYSKNNNNDDVYFKLCDLVMDAVVMTTDHWRMDENVSFPSDLRSHFSKVVNLDYIKGNKHINIHTIPV